MRIVLLIVLVLLITSCVTTIPDEESETPVIPDDPIGTDPSDGSPDEPADDSDEALPFGAFRGQYYASDDFTDLFETRIDDTIDFAWGQNAPIDGMPADYFSIRWEGRFLFEEDDYTFSMRTDDGMRIFLDGEVILESWKNQPPTDYSTTIAVDAGEHIVRVDYYEAYSTAHAEVSWTRGAAPDTEEDRTDPEDPIVDDPIERPVSDGVYGARPVPRSKTPSAGDTFVSPNGNGDCSQSNPCSLSNGISRGGHIWLNPGTYSRDTQIRFGSGKTLESIDPNNKAIIDFQRNPQTRLSIDDNNVIRNIVVRHSTWGVYVWGNNNLIEGVISEYNFYNGFQVWPRSGYGDGSNQALMNPDGGSYNTFRDSIGRYNNDDCCAISCGAATCSDSDSDGFAIPAGRGNVIEHCEAYGNTDDGIDFWRSYASEIRNSIAYANGYDNGARRGNGNGFKMGSRIGPNPNDHIVENNWAYGNAAYAFINNAGVGTTWGALVCTEAQESCKPVIWD